MLGVCRHFVGTKRRDCRKWPGSCSYQTSPVVTVRDRWIYRMRWFDPVQYFYVLWSSLRSCAEAKEVCVLEPSLGQRLCWWVWFSSVPGPLLQSSKGKASWFLFHTESCRERADVRLVSTALCVWKHSGFILNQNFNWLIFNHAAHLEKFTFLLDSLS